MHPFHTGGTAAVFMENGCRVNNAFILDERQPCIKTVWHEKRLPSK